MIWPFGPLRPLSYGVILADPPWAFRTYSDNGLSKSPQAHYDCMDTADIARLPVDYLAGGDSVLIMWDTAPMIQDALDLMAAWKFRFRTMGAWAKQSSTGRTWAFGTGYIYRSAAEFWILGVIGKPKPLNRCTTNLIVAKKREHSRKPDEMHARIEAQWSGPYCELFARQSRPGWDVWGNEVGKFDAGDRCDQGRLV